MNVDEITLKDAMELATCFGRKGDSEERYPFEVGQRVFIRTVTHHYLGEVSKVYGACIGLIKASWVADDGRFSEFQKTGVPNEVEVYLPETEVFIHLGSLIDHQVWVHTLPTEVR